MPIPSVPKLCPLLYIGDCLSPYHDQNPSHCIGDNCAWWTNHRCAIVELCAGVDCLTNKLDTIEGRLHIIANHGGDSR